MQRHQMLTDKDGFYRYSEQLKAARRLSLNFFGVCFRNRSAALQELGATKPVTTTLQPPCARWSWLPHMQSILGLGLCLGGLRGPGATPAWWLSAVLLRRQYAGSTAVIHPRQILPSQCFCFQHRLAAPSCDDGRNSGRPTAEI